MREREREREKERERTLFVWENEICIKWERVTNL